MKLAVTALAMGLALAIPGNPAIAQSRSHAEKTGCGIRPSEPASREALNEDVTNMTIQAAFHPSDDRQRLLSLLLLISTQRNGGSSR